MENQYKIKNSSNVLSYTPSSPEKEYQLPVYTSESIDNDGIEEVNQIFDSKLFISEPKLNMSEKKNAERVRGLRSRFLSLDEALSDNSDYNSENNGNSSLDDKLEDLMCNLFNDKHEV